MRYRSNIYCAMENLFMAQAKKRHPEKTVWITKDEEFVTLFVKHPSDEYPELVLVTCRYADTHLKIRPDDTIVRGGFQICKRLGKGADARTELYTGPDLISYCYEKAIQAGMVDNVEPSPRFQNNTRAPSCFCSTGLLRFWICS